MMPPRPISTAPSSMVLRHDAYVLIKALGIGREQRIVADHDERRGPVPRIGQVLFRQPARPSR